MKKVLLFAYVLLICHLLFINSVKAEMLERIVAIVNDDVILLSEFRDTLQTARKSESGISEEMVLNEMINRLLLLNESKRFRIGASDKRKTNETDNSAVIREYIDRRIKAFIHIPHEEIEYYYQMNIDIYEGKEFYDVSDEIEEYLVNKELSAKLHEYIEELRGKAYIRIQLRGSFQETRSAGDDWYS